jgi:hypothetical protein
MLRRHYHGMWHRRFGKRRLDKHTQRDDRAADDPGECHGVFTCETQCPELGELARAPLRIAYSAASAVVIRPS